MADKKLSYTLRLIDKFTRPLRKIQSQVTKFSHHASEGANRFRDAFIGGAVAIYGFAKAVMPSAEFQDRLNMMKVGSQENIKAIEGMEQSALRLNKQLAGGLTESLDILDLTRQKSGLAGKELEIMAGNTMVLNKRFKEMDHKDLLKAQTQLMRDFKISAGTAGDMVGYLASKGGDLKEELLDSIHEYSPQFKSLGFNIQQMVATTQAALQGGWSVDKGIDAIKEAGLKLRELDKDSKGALAELGLSHIGEQLQAGKITTFDALSKIGPKIAKIQNDTKKFNLFKQIFGTPSEDVGLQGMLDIMGGMSAPAKFAGTMNELKKGVNKGMLGMLRKLRAGFENLSYSIMSRVLPILGPVVEYITKGTDRVQSWTQKFPYLTKAVGIAVLAVFGLILAVSSFALITGVAHFVIAGVRGVMILWRIAIIGVKVALFLLRVAGVLGLIASVILMITIIGIVKGAMLLWQGVIWLVNSALLANPITWVVLAIIALIAVVYLVIKYWDQLKAAIIGVAEWFDKMPGWVQILGMVFLPFIFIPLKIIANWKRVKAWFSEFWDWLSNGFTSVIDTILDAFKPVTNLINKVGSAIGLDLNIGETETEKPATSLANAHVERAKSAVVPGAANMIKKYNQSTSNDNRKSIGEINIYTDKEMNVSNFRTLLYMQGAG